MVLIHDASSCHADRPVFVVGEIRQGDPRGGVYHLKTVARQEQHSRFVGEPEEELDTQVLLDERCLEVSAVELTSEFLQIDQAAVVHVVGFEFGGHSHASTERLVALADELLCSSLVLTKSVDEHELAGLSSQRRVARAQPNFLAGCAANRSSMMLLVCRAMAPSRHPVAPKNLENE